MKIPYSRIRVKDCMSNRLRFSCGSDASALDFHTGEELFQMTHLWFICGFKSKAEYDAARSAPADPFLPTDVGRTAV